MTDWRWHTPRAPSEYFFMLQARLDIESWEKARGKSHHAAMRDRLRAPLRTHRVALRDSEIPRTLC